jgi:glyoxylase-like metal-dependent hydrolase (beta-lactamase superfamily II)/8-oxo-dGTP pyrophosphatase MutT (NUDIX family)
MAEKPAPPKPVFKEAATLLLLKEDGTVFWARRPAHSSFLATFHVFPGGAVDETDASPAHAAVRETLEETGIEVAAEDLHAAGRFMTPPFSPVRFDTSFFVARVGPDAQARLAAAELEAGEWIAPGEALERWRRDEAILAAPTRIALEVLARSGARTPDVAARELERAAPGRGEWSRRIELRPGVFVFPVRTPTLPPATHTNTLVLGDGPEVVVIDPASPYPEEQEALHGLVADLVREGRRVKAILLTHRHVDHVSGADDLARRTGAPILAHPLVKDALRGTVGVTGTLEDGQVIELAAPSPRRTRRVRPVLTEGHARGHLAFFEETSRTLVAGDMVAGYGWILIDPPEGDMQVYLDSLARLRALGASLLLPAHGPPIGDPNGKLDEYVRHRLAREAKVLAAFERGARALPDVVLGAYEDTPPALHGLAARAALAHLLKLQAEGRIPAASFAPG